MNLEEKQIKAEYMYKGRIINLRKDEALLPNGASLVTLPWSSFFLR